MSAPPSETYPISSPIHGSRTLFVTPRGVPPNSPACKPTQSMNIPADNEVPLLSVALAPLSPLEIGSLIYARMLGPPEGDDPRNRRRTSKEIGVEGRIVAARAVGSTHVEFMVKNESWSLANYVAILVLAVPDATVSRDMLSTLSMKPRRVSAIEKSERPVEATRVAGIPGSGPRDTDLLYLIRRPTTSLISRFKQPAQRLQPRSDDEITKDVMRLRGPGWKRTMERV